MNKPIIVAMAALAVLVSTTTSAQFANAQYEAGTDTGAVGPEQLAECEQLGIDRNQCTNVAILAKKRVTAAQAAANDPAKGSGTAYLTGSGGETIAVIAALGAIFGGVAAAFFFKGRGAKQVTT